MAADINGDGFVDLIVANGSYVVQGENYTTNANTLTVFTNARNGGFVTAATYALNDTPTSIALFTNVDHKVDFAVATGYNANDYQNPQTEAPPPDKTITVFLNDGNGNFSTSTNNIYTLSDTPNLLIAVDVNGDGKVDLVSAGFLTTLTVLTNNGSGGFVYSGSYTEGVPGREIQTIESFGTADVNGDGKPDLITLNQVANSSGDSSALTVVTNNGDGTFAQSGSYRFPDYLSGISSLAIADLNGDGKPDLIAAAEFNSSNNANNTLLLIVTNDGTGNFVAANPITINQPLFVIAADVNHDGKMDLIVNGTVFANTTVAETTNLLNFSYTFSGGVSDPGAVLYTDANGNVITGGFANTILSNTVNTTIGGGQQNTNDSSRSVIAGGTFNTIQPNAFESAIGGGERNTIQTRATFSFIGGGDLNTIETNGQYSVIGGGFDNKAGGIGSFIGGGGVDNTSFGNGNMAEGNGSVIVGGVGNSIQPNANDAAIGGGYANTVQNGALAAVIPGGSNNVAGGNYSFAAGQQAQALHQGAFVWADSQDASFASTTNDQFLIRAGGGVGIGTATPGDTLEVNGGIRATGFSTLNSTGPGVEIDYNGAGDGNGRILAINRTAPGTLLGLALGDYFHNKGMLVQANGNVIVSGTVTANGVTLSSDRNLKESFKTVDGGAVLAKVAAMPMTEWQFKTTPEERHLGPMAQDFRAAFGLGGDDKHIAVTDEGGVALAAIQGLNEKLESEGKAKDAEIAELKARLEKLERLVNRDSRSGK